MIEVENITKWYGPTLAVDNLSFNIPKGRIVGFLGPNGAGKSTTLRILAGFMPPTSGWASVAGHDVVRESEQARSQVGYMPENNPLYPEMRVDEYLHFRGKLFGFDREARNKRIDIVCDRCGLAHLRKRVIGHLSKGNRQRVGLAQSLLHNPKVLILDEPTSGLDPIQIVEIRKFLEELRDEHTIILSSHILTEIEKVADRIMIIRQGKLVAEGTVDELCTRAKHRVSIALEMQVNPATAKTELSKLPGVQSIETTSVDGWCKAMITPRDGHDIRPELFKAVAAAGWPTRSFTMPRVNLEDYYQQVFRQPAENERA